MSGVLSGFFIVWALIGIGWAIGRTGVLGSQARFVLNRVTFFLASPALVFVALLSSDPTQVLSAPMAVATIAGLGTGAILLLGLRIFTRRRGADLVIAAISGSVVNGANMGFPISAYVLGDISHAVPVILFQQAVYMPLYLFVLHSATVEARPGLAGVARNIGSNPTIISAVIGLVLVAAGVELPTVVLEPIRALADMAIPGMLLAYGLSLIGSAPFSRDAGYRGLILVSAGAKLLLMPLIALGLGLALGLRDHALYAVVVMAALPTAQNVYVAAARYEASEELARDTVLVTTVGTVAVLLVVSAALGV